MPTEHIYDGTHSVSNDLLRHYGEQRHIFFTTNPEEVRRFENCVREVREYSERNLSRVSRRLREMNDEENKRTSIYKILESFNCVEEFVLDKKQQLVGEGECSEGHHEWITPNKNQLNWCVKQVAGYFTGISRVDLYAAVSGNTNDTKIARRILSKKQESLIDKLDENQKKIDSIFIDLMEIPQKSKGKNGAILRTIARFLPLSLLEGLYTRTAQNYGEAVSYSPIAGEAIGFEKTERSLEILEEEYERRGFKPVPRNRLQSFSYGLPIADCLRLTIRNP